MEPQEEILPQKSEPGEAPATRLGQDCIIGPQWGQVQKRQTQGVAALTEPPHLPLILLGDQKCKLLHAMLTSQWAYIALVYLIS